jgi:outer membrane receptor for ferrienterochelin and colicins
MLRVTLLAGVAGAVLLSSGAAYAQTEDQPETVIVTARKLDEARAGIQTQLGASTYTIDEAAIAAMPGGDNANLNQVLLQIPGVVQDQYGQVHIRAEHNALQYRLDGIVLPEGISVFSQTLDPRLAGSVRLITGALPAEYGLVTGGIVDVQTKTGLFDSGGQISMYGGDHSDMQPSGSYGGSSGNWNYFVEGDYLQNRLGIDSPDGESNPHHDYTSQYHGFGYAENILDANSRIAMFVGTSHDNFEIPDVFPGVLGLSPTDPPPFTVTGGPASAAYSEFLNDRQAEITHFGAVSYLHSEGTLDLEISAFSRFSSLAFSPDQNLGDLAFTGISQNAYKRDIGYGLQSDNAWRAAPDHTVRFGFLAQKDDLESQTSAQVLPATCTGSGTVANPFSCAQSSNTPFIIDDNGKKTSQSFSVYVQDEWQIQKWLTANYGVRYDQYTAFSEGNQVSPRLNFVIQPLEDTTLHAGYARYFSPPPFELIASESVAKFSNPPSTATPAVTADATPVAERADYFDTGAQQKLNNTIFADDDMTLGVDGFLKMSHDLIDEGQFGAPIILTPFNYKRGLQYGVDYSLTYDTGPFSAYANLNFQHAMGKDIVTSQFNFGADELAFIQDHYIHLDHEQAATASAGVSYLWQGTRFSLDGIYGSGLREDNTLSNGQLIPNGAPLKAYVQANFGVMRTFTLPEAGDVQLRMDVINITDTAYEIRSGTGVGVGAPSWGERRSIYFGITKPFG